MHYLAERRKPAEAHFYLNYHSRHFPSLVTHFCDNSGATFFAGNEIHAASKHSDTNIIKTSSSAIISLASATNKSVLGTHERMYFVKYAPRGPSYESNLRILFMKPFQQQRARNWTQSHFESQQNPPGAFFRRRSLWGSALRILIGRAITTAPRVIRSASCWISLLSAGK
jgi:hypothetical protein